MCRSPTIPPIRRAHRIAERHSADQHLAKAHRARTAIPTATDIVADNVVLLVRGELLKRYPNAISYAGKAEARSRRTARARRSDERYPIFRGTLSRRT